MKKFEFERRGIKYTFRVHDDDTGDVYVYREGGTFYTVSDVVDATGIRALLSRDAEREAIFVEAIRLAREISYCSQKPIEHGEYDKQLDALAARWQATTGDATGAGTVKEATDGDV